VIYDKEPDGVAVIDFIGLHGESKKLIVGSQVARASQCPVDGSASVSFVLKCLQLRMQTENCTVAEKCKCKIS